MTGNYAGPMRGPIMRRLTALESDWAPLFLGFDVVDRAAESSKAGRCPVGGGQFKPQFKPSTLSHFTRPQPNGAVVSHYPFTAM